ncbi:unnamed protein product, partial [marine sediment metagenome]
MSDTIITDAEALKFLRLPSTIVDQNSLYGQPILYVQTTINFDVGDKVIIARGTAREEVKTILRIQNGISLTMTVNLEWTHSPVNFITVEAGYQDAEIIHGMNLSIDRIIKNHCSRCFNQELQVIEYLDGDGGREVWLADYP